MKKYVTIALLLIALAVGGALLMFQGNDAVTLATNVKDSVLMADTVNASFQGVAGRVVSVEVGEQQNVKAGDIIMKLDTTDIDIQISQLELSIAQQNVKIKQASIQVVRPEELEKQKIATETAKESLEQTQRNYDKLTFLYSTGEVSKEELDNVATQLDVARNTLAMQEAQVKNLTAQNNTNSQNYEYNKHLLELQKDTLDSQLEALKLQKQRMILKAPIDGKVTKLVPKAGENISSGSTAAIVQSNNLYISIYIDETQVSKFAKGNLVVGTVPALQEQVKGTVRSVASAPQYASLRMSRDKGQSDTSAFLVVVDMETSSKLLPGMTVEVDVDECNS